ncbi:hypothetical protein HNP67_000929 [Borreliella californiensis]|uniref:Lipoprotein n=1 Tax=Borreliella californiensis TaxID=373543 RepID=A0A7W9ZND3_9SPIR|nr:hypothetical protein [Borreliella californiensis]MBB6213407.1 hypothetical protein [Borreliella californiensis]MBB6213434.1 hypothetical protein [Borreliella californiensis]WKC91312.1 hypothetical protein QIA17_00465 [Borreliella californiensis]WNY70972.1 hypothetical protein QIA39_04710 [Borreliella californiensis]
MFLNILVLKERKALKSKLRKAIKILTFAPLLLVISCNANMDTNDKNKALNEYKLQNISEVIKNSLQLESDTKFKKELESKINQSTPPILEIEKIEPGKQEIALQSEFDSEGPIPLEVLEEANMAKSEEEIAKIQEQLLLIGASDEITGQELGENIQKSLHPTTIEFKISTSDNEVILTPIEEEKINNDKDKIFDQKEENDTLKNDAFNKSKINPTQNQQNQFQKHSIHLRNNDNFITKEYANQVRDSLDKALNAIKNLETSKEFKELENLPKDLESSLNKSKNSIESNIDNINTKNIETTKNRLLEELKNSELVFEDTKDPLGTSTIKRVMDAAKKWGEKENTSQIDWNLGFKFHPNPKLYNKLIAQEYKILAEKFTKVKNEYKNTKEQLKAESKLTTNSISKIIDATKEFANQVRNLILLVENNHQ